MGWWLGLQQPPWSFGFDSQTRGTRENRVTPCVKVGSHFDLSMTHDRFGSSSHVQQTGVLSHPQDLDAPLHLAAHRKINIYRQQFADNQNISFLPPIVNTQVHACTASFCVFIFYRPTGRQRSTSLSLECHRNATTRTRFVSSVRHSTSC